MKPTKKNTKVNITIPLEGKEAEMFLRYQEETGLNNNTQTARTLLLPTLKAEIAKLMQQAEMPVERAA